MPPPRILASISTVDRGTGGRRLVVALAVTQTIGYGVLSYAFAVFLTPMAADLHTSTTAVTGAATLAVLVAAGGAIPVGRWIDRRGGRGLMTAGSMVGALAVAAWSQVHGIGPLYAVFAVIGVASAMVLYEPAFAVIVAHVHQHRRQTAILAVTIVAGFAGSIFLPLAGFLNAHLGWRDAILTLAVLYAAGTIPLHALALPRAHPRTAAYTPDREPQLSTVLRNRGFLVLAATFVAQSAAVATISVHLVSYLTTLGHPPSFAAAIAGLLGALSVTGRLVTTGLLGALSVTGRLVTTGLRRRHSTAAVTAAVFAIQAVAAAAFPALGHSSAGAIGCTVLFGLGFGVSTIARPALLTERYDTAVYATLAGTLAAPATLAKAAAPLAAALLALDQHHDPHNFS